MENGSTSRRTLKSGSLMSQSTITSMTSVNTYNKPLIIAQKFRIGKKFGSGNFGEVRYGRDIYTGKYVAIKLESNKTKIPQLHNEYKYYRILENGNGIPNVYYYGPFSVCNALVLELLGPNLENLFMKCGRKFSQKTVLMIAMQLIRRFEFIHSKGIIFRDVKPENFVIGNDENTRNIIYIIDFGLAKQYIDQETQKHIPYCENKGLSGTARYMSVHTHAGIEQSRRDDLESLGHMLIYLLRGALPWQGLKAENIYDRYEKIAQVKNNTSIFSLCSNLSDEWVKYMEYVKNLQFYQDPDYDFMFNIFYVAFQKHHYVMDYLFDWMHLRNLSNNSDQDSLCSQSIRKSTNIKNDISIGNKDESKISEKRFRYPGDYNDSKHYTLPNNSNIIRSIIRRTETYFSPNDPSLLTRYIKPRTTLTSIGLNDLETNKSNRGETFRSHCRKPTPSHFPIQKLRQRKMTNPELSLVRDSSHQGVSFSRMESTKFNFWSCCYKFRKIQNNPSDSNLPPNTLNQFSKDHI